MKQKIDIIPMEKLITGRVYKIWCRNLLFGVYDGHGGFIGIRTKFDSRFLDTEYHWDKSVHHGTVSKIVDTGVDVPTGIEIKTSLGSIDDVTKRMVDFDKPVVDGGRGWYFLDTGESSKDIRSYRLDNKKLFNFLEYFENKAKKWGE